MSVYVTRYRYYNGVMTKRGQEKYFKFISLSCAWECANIISMIYKGREPLKWKGNLIIGGEVENKKCWSSGKVGLTSSTVALLRIQ